MIREIFLDNLPFKSPFRINIPREVILSYRRFCEDEYTPIKFDDVITKENNKRKKIGESNNIKNIFLQSSPNSAFFDGGIKTFSIEIYVEYENSLRPYYFFLKL